MKKIPYFHIPTQGYRMSMGVKTPQIPTDDLRHDIIDTLLRDCPDELKALDEWTLFANNEHLPLLANLQKKLATFYAHPKYYVLYRGFDVGGIQDAMGLPLKGRLTKSLNAELGATFTYTVPRPTSFSIDPVVSGEFGKQMVQATVPVTRDFNASPITPELSAIIYSRRNLPVEKMMDTQSEIIVFPGLTANFTVVKKDGVVSSDTNLKTLKW